MTRQYLVGEMSALLAELCPPAEPRLAEELTDLRRQVETGSPAGLADIVERALTLADCTCWSAIDAGNLIAFQRQAAAAEHLSDFAVAAGMRTD